MNATTSTLSAINSVYEAMWWRFFLLESDENIIRVEFFGDEIDRITEIQALTGEFKANLKHVAIYPASHYIVPKEKMQRAICNIEEELAQRVRYFKENEKLIEAQRIEQRTNYDVEMLQEIGFCKGIENYSRILSGRSPGPFHVLYWTISPMIFYCLSMNLM